MTDPKSISSLVEQIKEQNLHIHVLINNAGTGMISSYTESSTGIEITCHTNYYGVVQLTEEMTPLLLYFKRKIS